MQAYQFHIYLDNGGIRPDYQVSDGHAKSWSNSMPSRLDEGDTVTFIIHAGARDELVSVNVYTRPLLDNLAASPFSDAARFAIPLDTSISEDGAGRYRFTSQTLVFGQQNGRWCFTLVGVYKNLMGSHTPWIIDPETQVGAGDVRPR
ncbi:hypothetical protein HSX11_02190 [Oxalobacteraceae bacterium]|nr:hypothetical protein [Oxalobacteraceae bacterium]